MFLLFEAIVVDLLTTAPDLMLLLGAHEIPRFEPKKFITVRQHGQVLLVER